MPVKLNSTGGGSVTITAPSTASDFTATFPAVTGNVVTTGSSAVVTPAMLSTGAPNWDSSGNLSFNSGYGSAAVAYGCRAWVNFNGTGTVAIRASGNVTSITDNGVGSYTINFTNTMPDANYILAGCHEDTGSASGTVGLRTTTITTSAISIFTNTGTSFGDATYVHAAIFR